MDRDLSGWDRQEAAEGEEHLCSTTYVRQASPLTTDAKVPGRIKGHQTFYKKIGAEPYVVQIVRDGYKLELDTIPPPSFTCNNKSALTNINFVTAELARLERLGCVRRVAEQPTVVLPLSLVYSSKWRLVLDASRGLNPYCTSRGIKLDDLTHVPHVVQQKDFMIVNDLDSGFWHVPVHPAHQQYLGVHIMGEEGKPIFWVWQVLVLGLKDACHVFTRIISPIMSKLRKEGFRGQIYIDDLLIVASSKESALWWEQRVFQVFGEAGWIFKPAKRSGEPAQVCRFLGLEINSITMCFQIPEDKIATIQERLKKVKTRQARVRELARLVGTLQAVRLATGPIVSVMTRSLYVAVDTAATWSSWVTLSKMALQEITWWQENIEEASRFPISDSQSTTPVAFEVASDASGVGYFSYLVGSSRTTLAARAFSEEERRESSTWRELAAFHDTWTKECNLVQFAGQKVAHYTDNQAMASVVCRGSKNERLQPLVVEAVLALRRHGVSMSAVWRSREDGLICYADKGSRDFHADDISLDEETMLKISQKFGSFDVDTFAAAANSKGARFYSKLDVPGSAGMNCFHQSLNPNESHFCFPPPHLLVAALRHIQRCGVTAVMVVPVWANSTYFSVFWPDGRHGADFIARMMFVQPTFICGPLVASWGMKGKKSYQTAVCLVDSRVREGQGAPSRLAESCLQGGCEECT